MIDFCLRCRRMPDPDEDVFYGFGPRFRSRDCPYPRLPACECRDDAVIRRVGFNPVSWKLTILEAA